MELSLVVPFICSIFVLNQNQYTMTIIAIFGTTVEFSYANSKEIEYMEIDEFTEQFGVEAFQEYDSVESDEGVLYIC